MHAPAPGPALTPLLPVPVPVAAPALPHRHHLPCPTHAHIGPATALPLPPLPMDMPVPHPALPPCPAADTRCLWATGCSWCSTTHMYWSTAAVQQVHGPCTPHKSTRARQAGCQTDSFRRLRLTSSVTVRTRRPSVTSSKSCLRINVNECGPYT